ncbi:hypothetical protein EG68_10903 [Paragonimus skrjabini miyazakii]|uniref:FAR1 domain-containing protein n=1 Tax=Paragonimus skrjabini miyazakii TaxID=59628 RepID=A0A8S9YFI0_9TREM|nr:hypothetical protein EG68_10903 [Paragonimus skrjabini miyazakii]
MISVAADFRRDIQSRKFSSYLELKEALDAFMKKTCTNYVVRGSAHKKHSKLQYNRLVYMCDQYPRRRSVSKGLRRVNSQTTDCTSRFYVHAHMRWLIVTSAEMEHNHPLNESVVQNSRAKRRLTADEIEESKALFVNGCSNDKLKQYALERFGKQLTTHDIWNIRSKLTNIQSPDT